MARESKRLKYAKTMIAWYETSGYKGDMDSTELTPIYDWLETADRGNKSLEQMCQEYESQRFKGLTTIGETGVVLGIRGASIPTNITYEQAESAVQTLTRLDASVKWALIDVIAMSRGAWGEMYDQMIEATQLSPGTLANMMNVWLRFQRPEDRLWDLSFSHYTAVAVDTLDPETRGYILDMAVDGGLSRDQVRDIVKQYGPNPIVTPPFSKEVFVGKIQKLIEWAEANDAPDSLVAAVKELFKEFTQQPNWDF